jgi:hypothetical protein
MAPSSMAQNISFAIGRVLPQPAQVVSATVASNAKTSRSRPPAALPSSVEPPSEVAVKVLGAIDVRNRKDDDLELHVDRACGGACYQRMKSDSPLAVFRRA